ncbi:hypothetical protein Tco_0326632 [Tanacetum coccineum]
MYKLDVISVINASGQWKYSFYTSQKFTTPKEAKDRLYLHSIKSKRNLKLYKNESVWIKARCDGKVHVFTMSQGTGPTSPNRRMKARPSGSSGLTTMSKTRKNTSTNDDSQASYSILNAHYKGDLCPWFSMASAYDPQHVGVPVQWTLVAKINEKGECGIIIWNIREVYTFHSWTDILDFPKDFSIDSTLLVG